MCCVALVSALVLTVLMAGTYAIGRRIGRHNVVDAAWGVGFALVSLVALVLGDGESGRRALMFVLVSVWGLRLGGYLAIRSRGKGEDPRYEALLAGGGQWTVILKIYVLQALLIWFISLPVQVNATLDSGLPPLARLGLAVWAIGLFFEAVGDWQMARFKASNPGQVMDQGLWRYTRHPNYFGDACVWWGIFIVAATEWPGVLTVLSPVVMTVLLTRVSGASLLEKHMASRPGYADYVRRTSGFLPRPPKRS